MRTSALAPLAAAIMSAITGDAALMALLVSPGIYQGNVPPGAATPYLTLTTPSESAANTFGRAGTSNAEQIHVWASNPHAVRLIAMEVSRVLGDGVVTVTGFDLVARDVQLVTILRDPDSGGYHGVLRFVPQLLAVSP